MVQCDRMQVRAFVVLVRCIIKYLDRLHQYLSFFLCWVDTYTGLAEQESTVVIAVWMLCRRGGTEST